MRLNNTQLTAVLTLPSIIMFWITLIGALHFWNIIKADFLKINGYIDLIISAIQLVIYIAIYAYIKKTKKSIFEVINKETLLKNMIMYFLPFAILLLTGLSYLNEMVLRNIAVMTVVSFFTVVTVAILPFVQIIIWAIYYFKKFNFRRSN